MPFGGSAREGHAGTLLQHHLIHGVGLAAAGKLVSSSSAAAAAAGAGGFWEPRSVLDHRHSPSPSPPTSASTLSSPLADVAALAGANAKNVSVSPPPPGWGTGGGGGGGEEVVAAKEEWVHQLTPLDMGLGAGEGWDAAGNVLSDAAAAATSGMAPDNTFLRWIIGGGEDASAAMAGVMDPPATTFAESQAESLLSKVHVRGFRVEKRAGSLCLYWQRGELVSVSAWRC
ncbi:hypothetical protein OsJ_32390 [Oryza sativa Japonica Group]|uniref:Uncharacterized protein n=1 Tax=Oryza sativa subsp. japonica TaxID=39947 RepID=B9G6X2_ORYSJ|nr:hypothetical protein OsJ_32390 [Oryza sativa Japonica Group]